MAEMIQGKCPLSEAGMAQPGLVKVFITLRHWVLNADEEPDP
jgi:hypothetical protein